MGNFCQPSGTVSIQDVDNDNGPECMGVYPGHSEKTLFCPYMSESTFDMKVRQLSQMQVQFSCNHRCTWNYSIEFPPSCTFVIVYLHTDTMVCDVLQHTSTTTLLQTNAIHRTRLCEAGRTPNSMCGLGITGDSMGQMGTGSTRLSFATKFRRCLFQGPFS